MCAVLLGAALVAPASAGPALDWDPMFTWEAGATATNSPAGGDFFGVGIISSFGPPFDFLNPNDPTKEYTFYIYNLDSQGTAVFGPPGTQFYVTDYNGGNFDLYEGTPRNSVFAPNPPNASVPSTFTDGTLLLSGNFTRFQTQTNDFTAFQVGNLEGDVNFTGGSLYDLTFRGGQPCPGLFTGGVTWRTDVLIPGYIFRHDGKLDLNCPVPAEQSSWGKIKAQYH
jgi:hypothetical protein